MAFSPKKTYESIDAWKAEAVKRFGTNADEWKFVCPSCKRVQSAAEFESRGFDPNQAPQQCIGRFTGMRTGPDKCDWAAFGLFGGPIYIKHEGKEIPVFDFAET